ncbi:MAG: GGDEF domain-containing protein [Burkholderiaceae bacterium]|nr:GGDEF domain-containing protein [Burkholderiaceae bacterium]
MNDRFTASTWRTAFEAKQALRMRRFLMAVATYAVCGTLAQLCAWLGYLPTSTPMWWVIGVTAGNLGFFVMIHSGRNLRLRDPSMTELQLIFSMFAAMALIAQADEARGAMLMFLPVPLLFGILRLNFHQMARVSTLGFVAYVVVISSIWLIQPQRINLALELFYLVALATVMVFVCLMSGYISKVRADLALAVKKIDRLAHRDPLTGLFNRRHLMERLEVDISRCNRQRCRGITLFMIDLDYFKRVNDTFGHPVGDEVLVLVGNCLVNSTRDMDCVARYGGEEFVILLDTESDDLALSMSERIRAQVQELRIPALEELSISVSIGIANLTNGESSLSLIKRADDALYLAKGEGRNRVRAAAHADVLSQMQQQHLNSASSDPAPLFH